MSTNKSINLQPTNDEAPEDWRLTENDDDETVFSLDEYSQDSDNFYAECQSPFSNQTAGQGSGSLPSNGSTSSGFTEPPIGRLQRETPRQISGERQMYFPAMFVEEFRLGNVVFNIPGILKDSLRPSDSIDIKFDFIGHDLNKEYIHSKLSNLPRNGASARFSNSGEDYYDLAKLREHTISNSSSNNTTQQNLSSSLSTVSN